MKAAEVFELTLEETEALANKAGLSLAFLDTKDSFLSEYFRICSGDKTQELVAKSNVTERMLEYIKKGTHPSKETIIAVAIAEGLTLDNIQTLLKRTGYILSRSLPNDMVVLYFLEHRTSSSGSASLVWQINLVLDELNLPMLGTRFYQDKW